MKLIVMDMQKGILEDEELFRRESVVENAAKIIAAARESGVEVIYVQHDDGPDSGMTAGDEAFEIVEALAPRAVAFSDDGHGVQDGARMREAMLRAKALGRPIAAHCEDNSLLRGGYIHDGAYAAAHGHRGICSESEWGQIARDLHLAEEIGCAYGIGRDMHVGDTIIGIKGRVGFEAAAPMLIIGAHKFLEKFTLSKWQQYWKDQVANWYGMFLHESQYLEPVMPDIEAMLTSSQRNVTGTAILKLRPFSFETVGIDSENDLTKSKLGEYGETQTGWTADEAKGFIKVSSTPLRVYYGIHKDEKR